MQNTTCKMTSKPNLHMWDGHTLIRISSVPGFAKWLYGQTLPLVDNDPDPFDWAYYYDYVRFTHNLPVID